MKKGLMKQFTLVAVAGAIGCWVVMLGFARIGALPPLAWLILGVQTGGCTALVWLVANLVMERARDA